jgi:hypothetical protein
MSLESLLCGVCSKSYGTSINIDGIDDVDKTGNMVGCLWNAFYDKTNDIL